MNKTIKRINISLLSLAFLLPVNVLAYTKTESVFNNLNTDGSINKTIVTNHICSKTKEEYIDNSELNDILNLNGNEEFKKEGNTLKWKSNGKDIYYQGTTSKSSPINFKIKYYLNDKEKNVKDIIGKKGNIRIKIDIENTLKNTVKVNGKVEEVYTPFIVMGGTIIDTKDNSNIKVTNGKVVETGNKATILSISTPGLYESLNIDELSKLDSMEISYDTNKFSLNNIYFVATPKLLEEKDIKGFENVDSLVNSINLLQSNMNQIEDGSKSLNEGLKNAHEGSNLIVKKVTESINSLKQSDENVLDEKTLEAIKLKAITGATLSDEELNQIGLMASTKATLSDEQLKMISNKALLEVGTITLSDEQKEEIKKSVDNSIDTLYKESIVSNARSSVDNLVNGIIESLVITPENIVALSGNQVDIEVATTISTNLNNTIKAKLENAKSTMYSASENNALASAKQIAENSALSTATSVSNSVASKLVPSVATKTASSVASMVASETAKETASTTSKQVASKLAPVVAESVAKEVKNEATKQIKENMITLNNGLVSLDDGINKLYEGSNKLNDGITRFNNEGIKKISNYTYKINSYKSKAEALVELSKNYKGYTSDNSTETIFINKVKSIK
ncbi:MAG: hypothetical protein IIZ67_01990 [Bacilli bacterium]|nr:hypothetical protein [Bacilli bacterium]